MSSQKIEDKETAIEIQVYEVDSLKKFPMKYWGCWASDLESAVGFYRRRNGHDPAEVYVFEQQYAFPVEVGIKLEAPIDSK